MPVNDESSRLLGIRQRPRPKPVFSFDDIRIIHALVLRYARLRSIRQPMGFLAEFFRPTVICIAHYYMFYFINRKFPSGISLEQVIWAGFMIWFTFTRVYQDIHAPFHVVVPQFPGVTRMHMRIAICIWAILINGTFAYVSVLLMDIFGDSIAMPNLPLTLIILTTAAALGLGLGLCIEGLGRAIPFMHPVFHLLPYFIFISSGIYFSAATTPWQMDVFFLYNPLLHLVEYERYAFYSGYPIRLVSLTYPILCSAGVLILGLAINRRFRHLPAE